MLEWNETHHKLAAALLSGSSPEEAAELAGCSGSLALKVKKALASGDLPPKDEDKPPPEATWEDKLPPIAKEKLARIGKGSKPDGEPAKLPKLTSETVDAVALQLIPQIQQVPLTPGIYNGYLCAKIRGFTGTIADWLELCSVDFWTIRGKNPFAIVGGYASGSDDNKEGGQDDGKGRQQDSVVAGAGEKREG